MYFFENPGGTLTYATEVIIIVNVMCFRNGQDHTVAIRVINGTRTIRNNYLSGLTARVLAVVLWYEWCQTS